MGKKKMRTKRNRYLARMVLIGGCVALSFSISVAYPQKASSADRAESRDLVPKISDGRDSYQSAAAPLTADLLMEELLQMTDAPEGLVTKSSVERVFRTSLRNKKRVTETRASTGELHGTWYYAEPRQDWQFNLGVAEYSNGDSWFGFSLDSELQGPEFSFAFTKQVPKTCIEDLKFTEAIERQGWQLNRRTQLLGEHGLWLGQVVYQKGRRGILRLLFSPQQMSISPGASAAHCLERLAVDSSLKWERGIIESVNGYRDLPKHVGSYLHQSN